MLFETVEDQASTPTLEECNLRQSVSGLRKKRYTSAALCVVRQSATSTEDPTQHYTRLDDHGSYTEVSRKMLEELQKKFPQVFSEPSYPVDRTDVGVTFEHDIRLEDTTKSPPKKKIYTLDD